MATLAASRPQTSWAPALRLIAGRIGSALLTLLFVSLVVFVISGMLPGDAAQELLGQSATPEQVAALRHELGLDRPAHVRYFEWLTGMVVGNPGQSLVANMPVSEIIAERLDRKSTRLNSSHAN